LARLAEKMEKKDHDDDNNGPKGQIFVKGTQKFSSDLAKFYIKVTQYFFHFNVMYTRAKDEMRGENASIKP
jgi:hypothetical protein